MYNLRVTCPWKSWVMKKPCRFLLKFYPGFAAFAIFQDELEARISFKAFFLWPITERYDTVRFSKVTTKRLLRVKWIRREQNWRWTLTQAETFFLDVKSESSLVCRPCDSTSGNLNKTSVREKSRGVYLPRGWVFPSYSMIFGLC